MNIVCFPEQMDLNISEQDPAGGSREGGGSRGRFRGRTFQVADADVKYGLSVTGTMRPSKILKNNGCRAGDVLILSRASGRGHRVRRLPA